MNSLFPGKSLLIDPLKMIVSKSTISDITAFLCISLLLSLSGSIVFTTNGLAAELPVDQTTEPLQGEVEETGITPSKPKSFAPQEPMPMPVLPDAKNSELETEEQPQVDEHKPKQPLQATIEKSRLKAKEQWDDSDDNLRSLPGKVAPSNSELKGSAHLNDTASQREELDGEDPDAQDQELQIEWDKWRNRFLRAILAASMENINNPQATEFRWDPAHKRMVVQFPLGTTAWFTCRITNKRRIEDLTIQEPSGYDNYDRAVLNAVQSLDGTSILKFPTRSRRTVIIQGGGVKTSDQPQQQYFRFGDVERVRVP